MAVKADNKTFDTEISDKDKLVIADFYSDSCVPCKRMSPVLAELEEEYADSVKLVKLNINFDGETAEKYEIYAVPTLVFFKNGEEQTRVVGAVKKAELEDIINSL